MNDPDGAAAGDRSLRDLVADLLLYAPIGLALDAEELAPDLARRGRQHAATARALGEFAVRTGVRKLEDLLADARSRTCPPDTGDAAPSQTDEAPTGRRTRNPDGAPAAEPTAEAEPATTSGAPPIDADPIDDAPAVSVDELSIPDYDLLAASQVVKRLAALDPAELEAVRVYETTNRGRRTILTKIARLQA